MGLIVESSTTQSVRSSRGAYPRIRLWRQLRTSSNTELQEVLINELFQTTQESFLGQNPALQRLDILPSLLFLKETLKLNRKNNFRSLENIKASPLQFFGQSLELTIAPRHSYLRYLHSHGLTQNTATDFPNDVELTKLSSDPIHGIEALQLQSDDTIFTERMNKIIESGSGTDNQILDFKSFKRKFCQSGLVAARSSDHYMLKHLLDCGYDPMSDLDRNNVSVLHYAASMGLQSGALETVRLLVDNASIPSTLQAADMSTPIHWAATGANLEIFKFLCEESLKNQQEKQKNRQKHQKQHENFDSVDFVNDIILSRTIQNDTALHWAAGSGANDIITWILQQTNGERGGKQENQENQFVEEVPIDKRGITYQNKCQFNENPRVLEVKNMFGCTPAHFAASADRTSTCHLLYQYGANMLATNHHGHDPITKAVAFKKMETVLYLIKHVPGVNETLSQLRPWDDDRILSLSEIARIVGGHDIAGLLDSLAVKS